jgi:uncharacterized protein YjbI with pentapeptide repeats
MTTEQQLKERWKTPEGKKVRQQIIDHIEDYDWKKYLNSFPFVKEVKNGKDLRGICLSNLKFFKANFIHADLSGSDLRRSYFTTNDFLKANISNANLEEAVLARTKFRKAKILKSNIKKTKLMGADFNEADLRESCFIGSDLTNSKFDKANLSEVDFSETILRFCSFQETNLRKANLSKAIIKGSIFLKSDLSYVNMEDTDFSACSIISTNISSTKLKNSYIYGISTWDIETNKKTVMKDLVINRDPLITVNDIEIAQFIYLIINNKKISNVITSMRTKTVLILGSFDSKTRLILNKIKELLPNYDLIPIVFNFKPPLEQREIETIKTLALLSKFVIVDLSERSGQYFEVSIVPNTPVPFVTIAFEGTIPSRMLEGLNVFDWWRKEYFSYPEKGWKNKLPYLIEEEIIPWASKINLQLKKDSLK